MAKFVFRLQKVLEFRADSEAEAKRRFLGKRSEVLAIEGVIAEIGARRLAALSEPRSALDQFRMLESELLRLDDYERDQRVVLSVLNDEAESLRVDWVRHKQELETMIKLREKAEDEWKSTQERIEQAELDEWAVLRRAS